MVKKNIKKKDLIPLALFQLMSMKQKQADTLRNQLIEHLVENYNMKLTSTHHHSSIGDKKAYPPEEAWESFVNDSLWGDEFDATQFEKELKKQSRRK